MRLFTAVIAAGLSWGLITHDTVAQVQQWQWANAYECDFVAGFRKIIGDGQGNTYVCGRYVSEPITMGLFTVNAAGSEDMFLAKLAPDGTTLWLRSLAGSSDEKAVSIAVDDEGNLYLTGSVQTNNLVIGDSTFATGGHNQFVVIKFDPTGSVLWVRMSEGQVNCQGTDLVIDGEGNICFVGVLMGGTGDLFLGGDTLSAIGGDGGIVGKYAPDGGLIWAETFEAAGDLYGVDVMLTTLNGVVLSGNLNGSSLTIGTDTLTAACFLAAYDTNGDVEWTRSFGGSGYDEIRGSAIDPAGAIYAVGRFYGTLDFDGIFMDANDGGSFLVKFQSDGTAEWAVQKASAEYFEVGVSSAGQVLISGGCFSGMVFGSDTMNAPPGLNVFWAMYDGVGNELRAQRLGVGIAGHLAIDPSGDILLGGWLSSYLHFPGVGSIWDGPDKHNDMFVARSDGLLTGTIDQPAPISSALYPNPGTGTFKVSDGAIEVVEIYSSSGGLVHSQRPTSGMVEATLSPGVYMVKLRSGMTTTAQRYVSLP